ncbi:hypothetical protein B0T16DRAFT_796 [Cercophora newfieldiana]|uniref:Uncharacterized protein n=1 Tax=Cercophora newfieldiana TaxID=92897 RepID=A0AA39YLX0_9PEZI|nr:hypothetical protein B0T16DRAFT_796 [Cercophora newfieldiana]
MRAGGAVGRLSRPTGPFMPIDPYVQVQLLPSVLALPPSDTTCLSYAPSPDPGIDASRCSQFWLVVQRFAASPQRFRLDDFSWNYLCLTNMLTIFSLLSLLRFELTVRYRPGWMRCECRFWISKRICSLPKGTAEEVAKLGEHGWDRVRLRQYGAMTLSCALFASTGTMAGKFLVRSLGWFGELLPEGQTVDAKLGRGFLLAAWGGVMAVSMSSICVVVRFYLTRGVRE